MFKIKVKSIAVMPLQWFRPLVEQYHNNVRWYKQVEASPKQKGR